MISFRRFVLSGGLITCLIAAGSLSAASSPPLLERIKYNNPGLRTDVGVGLWGWPLPMDHNGDGLIDLVMASPGKPYNGVYVFENTGVVDPESGLPLLKAGVRLGKAIDSPQMSYVDGNPVVMTPGAVYPDFLHSALDQPQKIAAPSVEEIFGVSDPNLTKPGITGIRSSQWKLVDFDGDGQRDVIVGIDYWGEYKWASAFNGKNEPTYDENGKWKFGPLHGYVYWLRNTGTNEAPVYAKPVQLTAGDAPIDVYGRPSPCFGDFRGTGKLDLICGEFIDGFTYYENIGTRTEPGARGVAARQGGEYGIGHVADINGLQPRLACEYRQDQRRHAAVFAAAIFPAGRRRGEVRRALSPYGLRSRRRWSRGFGSGQQRRLHRLHQEPWRFADALGRPGVSRGGRSDHSHPGGLQR